MNNIKILMVCGNGLGSSAICELTVKAVLEKLEVEANLDHCDLSSVLSHKPDIIVTGLNFKSQFEDLEIDTNKTKIIYIKSLFSQSEIEEKIVPILKELQAL